MNKLTTDHTFFAKAAGQWKFPVTTSNEKAMLLVETNEPLRRIEKERTFVVFENGKLLFKADIAAETSNVYYLEGISVAPEMRGKGIGASCLAKLSIHLLERKQHICLLTNVDFTNVHRSFEKAGYKNTDYCTTIFV